MSYCFRFSIAAMWLAATITGQTRGPAQDAKAALIIGNDNYKYVTPLKTAVNDARAMQAILHSRYGFETNLLTDASRSRIMAALSYYRRTLTPDSSLLIYYAGHGYSDKLVDKTYWWPIDAQPEDPSEWISADDITTSVKAIPARHILIVSDSCFSGTLSRGVIVPAAIPLAADRERTLLKLWERPSRELLASGGNEPVADGGAGGHSVFAGALLSALGAMEPSEFSVEEVFRAVRESVGGRSSQLPELDPLRNSGHEGGSFVFTRLATAAPIPPPVAPAIDLDAERYAAVKDSRDPAQLDAVAAKLRREDLAEILRDRAKALRSAAVAANRPAARPAPRGAAPESFWGFTIASGGAEWRVRVLTNGASLGPRDEAIILSHLQDNLDARKTNASEFRPTEVLRITAAFDAAPNGSCPSSLAKLATITYQLETAAGVRLAAHQSKGAVCYGNDDEDAAVAALGKALAGINRDSILSLFKEIQ